MRGDILFWPAGNSLSDRVISWFTKGPFVHVAVDMGDGTEISAHSEDGIRRRPIPNRDDLTVYSIGGYAETLWGTMFLKEQIGKRYGFANVLNAILKRVRIPWRVFHVNRYDCSSLVAHYLEHCRIDLSDDDEAISPNDLARGLGLLK